MISFPRPRIIITLIVWVAMCCGLLMIWQGPILIPSSEYISSSLLASSSSSSSSSEDEDYLIPVKAKNPKPITRSHVSNLYYLQNTDNLKIQEPNPRLSLESLKSRRSKFDNLKQLLANKKSSSLQNKKGMNKNGNTLKNNKPSYKKGAMSQKNSLYMDDNPLKNSISKNVDNLRKKSSQNIDNSALSQNFKSNFGDIDALLEQSSLLGVPKMEENHPPKGNLVKSSMSSPSIASSYLADAFPEDELAFSVVNNKNKLPNNIKKKFSFSEKIPSNNDKMSPQKKPYEYDYDENYTDTYSPFPSPYAASGMFRRQSGTKTAMSIKNENILDKLDDHPSRVQRHYESGVKRRDDPTISQNKGISNTLYEKKNKNDNGEAYSSFQEADQNLDYEYDEDNDYDDYAYSDDEKQDDYEEYKIVEPGGNFNATPDNSYLLIYNRIPKCASSTMQTILRRLSQRLHFEHVSSLIYDQRKLAKADQKELVSNLVSSITAAPSGTLSYDRHLYYTNFTEFNADRPVYINVIRNPVERFISSFYYRRSEERLERLHMKTNYSITPSPSWINRTVEQCIEFNDSECTFLLGEEKEMMLSYFCGHHSFCRTVGSHEARQRAKQVVSAAYSVVGLVEQMELSLMLMENLLPRFMDGASKVYQNIRQREHKIVNKNKQKPVVSQAVKEELSRRMADDLDFYYFVEQRLFEQHKNFLSKNKSW